MGSLSCKCTCQNKYYGDEEANEPSTLDTAKAQTNESDQIKPAKRRRRLISKGKAAEKITGLFLGIKTRKKLVSVFLFNIDTKLRKEYNKQSLSKEAFQRQIDSFCAPFNETIVLDNLKASKKAVKLPLRGFILNKDGKEMFYYGNVSLNGEFQGEGIKIEGDYLYKGFFLYGKLEGPSTIIQQNESYFVGEMKDGLKNGFGTLQTKKSKYKGYWELNLFTGEVTTTSGKITIKDKYKKGEVEHRVIRDGQNNVFEGVPTGDCQIGGKIIFSDGSYYEGNMINGKFDGQGRYVWDSNHFYEGNYAKNRKEGKGIYKKDDFKLEGCFLGGQYNGESTVSVGNSTYTVFFRFGRVIKTKPTLQFSIPEPAKEEIFQEELSYLTPVTRKSKKATFKSHSQINLERYRSIISEANSRKTSISGSQERFRATSAKKKSMFKSKNYFKVLDDRSDQISQILEEKNREYVKKSSKYREEPSIIHNFDFDDLSFAANIESDEDD